MNTLSIILISVVLVLVSIMVGFKLATDVINKQIMATIQVMPVAKPAEVTPKVKEETNPDAEWENFDSGLKTDALKDANKVITGVVKEDIDTGESNLKNPYPTDVVEYGQFVCYKKSDIPEIVTSQQTSNIKKTCLNESLNQKFTTGKDDLQPFPVCQKSQSDVSNKDYFKKNYKYIVANLNDAYLDGYNIQEYDKFSSIYDIGKIHLTNNGKYPVPMNYVANTTGGVVGMNDINNK